ncbi:MAG: EAL domain-containing protein [Sideroxydans sp.]|jgi:diguanylate cyclase (GGDEF)-like protein/PAS domain S-box-containing protein
MKNRLSVVIPLVLMVVSITSSVLIYLQESRENEMRIEQLETRELVLQMTQLQNILYNRLTAGNEDEALLSLSLAAMRPHINSLMLVDERNDVILSNRYAHKGEPASARPLFSVADAAAAIRGGVGRVGFNPRQTALLQGYFPLVVSYQRGGLDKRMGVLYIEYDIGSHLDEARVMALEQSLVFAGITLGAALLIAFILHQLVSRPVHVLVEAAKRMAAGDYSVQTRLRGSGELSEVGHSFDSMVQRVNENIRLREQTESELQIERIFLHEAQKIGHLGSWELDITSDKLVWSDEIFRIFEIDQARFGASYEAFLNAIHPEDREKVNQAYSVSLVDRTPYQITHRLLMLDGRIKWVEERCSSSFDESGKPLRSIGTVQDVTERELWAEELRIAAVAFNTQEAIMVTDAHANIIKVNSAFTRITGYSQDEVLGRNPRLLSSGKQGALFYQQMWDAILQHGNWCGEIWDKRKDGSIYPKWLTITAVTHQGKTTHYVGVFIDITERKKAEEQILNMANYDSLTHLPNRRLLLDRLGLGLGQSARNDAQGALMFLDIDNFKTLNDTKGHEYGDKLLIQVARRMSACLRDVDSVARFGGDEFVVLLEGLSSDRDEAAIQAGQVAEKIRKVLAHPYQIEDVVHMSSSSIGVVLFKGDGVPVDELLKQADMAMYQAKSSGRNRVRFFESTMQAALESRMLMENALRLALQNGEMELHYQLQTDNSRALLGAEVLLRWHSKELGNVPPADFIPIAEQSNLILPIGHWVLETACKQLKAWESEPLFRDISLAVNISPAQFHQTDFVNQVKAVLADTGADPHRLKLELTENLVLEDINEATSKMVALRAEGVRFSMDDFGTGYSSLQYIKRLPIDQLKIDRSFVLDILTDPGDAVMVQTISDLARNFGFEVIAEGVETEDQLPSLTERGCDKFQGYLFSTPIAKAEFEKLVTEWKTS